MKRFPPLTREYVLSRLKVDTENGTCIWVDATKHHRPLVGKEAGVPRSTHSRKSYWHIKINGIPYKRSYIVFLIANGYWPDLIDHINGDSLDDRASNLREATPTQNAWNHKGRTKKSNLPMGIRLSRWGTYQARIACNKQLISKNFPTAEEAHRFYLQKRKELFGEYSSVCAG